MTSQRGTDRPVGVVEVTTDAAFASDGPAGLVVHDGDEVEASGTVVAVPGQPVRFCAPATTGGVGRTGEADAAPPCEFGITVTGVNLDTLTAPDTRSGVRSGSAYLRGIWRSGTLAVTRQAAPVQPPAEVSPPAPCPAPHGGWPVLGEPDGKAVEAYVDGHPDRFRRPWVSYPEGRSSPGTPAQVLVVEVVRGDVEQARRELDRRYDGNLCVVSRPGSPSIADQTRLQSEHRPAVEQLMRDRTNGVYGVGGADVITVDLVMVDARLLTEFQRIGLDYVELRPWLHPVR